MILNFEVDTDDSTNMFYMGPQIWLLRKNMYVPRQETSHLTTIHFIKENRKYEKTFRTVKPHWTSS